MIILDLNQTMISNLMMQLGNHTNVPLEESLLRHMVLNSIRLYRQKFVKEFGEIVIACDDKNYWRKQVFPYYKANRKKAREQSELDWTAIFESLNAIRQELKEYFPYKVIQVETAEADDVIGTLCKQFGSEGPLAIGEKILILSGDKDFNQLQKYSNVQQYDPVRKKFIKADDPYKYLQEHIIKGDSGDGIPNFLSDDNSLVAGIRQKPVTSKKLVDWIGKKPEEFCDETMLRNYKRNQQLVDLDYIPDSIHNTVIDQFNNSNNKDRSKLFNYFIKYKLKNLLESIGDF
jgi:5'-3' exonuclease